MKFLDAVYHVLCRLGFFPDLEGLLEGLAVYGGCGIGHKEMEEKK